MEIMFGETLYLWRTEAGLTQEELAEKLNVSRQTISNYENSHTQPSFDIFQDIQKLFQKEFIKS